MARRRGFEGIVILEVLVGSNGSVLDLRIASPSGHPILDKAAVRSVKNWVFDPGMKGKEIVEMWVKVPIRFELK
jgi:protein TonB